MKMEMERELKRMYCLKDLRTGTFGTIEITNNLWEYIKKIKEGKITVKKTKESKITDYENYEVYFVGEFDSLTGQLHTFKLPCKNLKEEISLLRYPSM